MIFSVAPLITSQGLAVEISKIFEVPSVKILLHIYGKGEVRFTDLTKLIASRGILSSNLKALEKEELMERRVVTSRPIQTFYYLTEKGQKVAKNLSEIESLFQNYMVVYAKLLVVYAH